MALSTFLPVLVAPLIGWRLYKRFHRLTRRQQLSATRARLSLLLCPLALALLMLACRGAPLAQAALALSALAGAALALYSQRLTRYESEQGTLYYTHNALIGMGLFALVIFRVGMRLFQWWSGDAAHMSGADANVAMLHTPLTMGLLGLILTYHACYAIGLLRWRRAALASPPPA